MNLQPNDKVHLTIENETFNARLIGKTDKKLMFERLKCDWSRFVFGGKLYKIYVEDLTNKVTIKKHEV